MAEQRVVFTLTCVNAPAATVFFEPEGSEHRLASDDAFRVEMVGPEPGEPEISFTPNGLIVGAWNKAQTRVWNRTGDELAT